MGFKKTWFSYVLWILLTGLTVLITYFTLSEVLLGIASLSFTGWPVYFDIGFKLLFTIITVGLCFLLHYISGKRKPFALSKWISRLFHILMFLLIVSAFVLLRLPSIINVQTEIWSEQAACFYRASMVGIDVTGISVVPSLLEQTYINVLSGLFLFLGNKVEILQYFQFILQLFSLVMMMFAGWKLQKGIYAWIPALFYAVSPFAFYAVEDVGPANFWMCVVLIGVCLICILEKVWKNSNITYVILVISELLFGAFVFFTKAGVLLYGKAPFASGGVIMGNTDVINIEMLVVAVLLIFYCVSFWFNKQDHKTLLILPFVGLCILFMWLSFYEYDVSACLMMVAALNLYFLTAESMHVTFSVKQDIPTGQIELNNIEESIPKEAEDTSTENIVIDKTAPIENVLPMPKKHTKRVLDYAFEPSEDQMHYDIEIENDDYDY